MKILLLSLISIFAFTLNKATQNDVKLEIGTKLPRKYTKNTSTLTATAASQLRPSIDKKINNVKYTIAFNKETREIVYIHTMDDNFRTINNLKVESEITFTLEELIIYPYWEVRAPATPDGWFPVIAHDMPMAGAEFIRNLKKGVKTTTSITGFSKGYN